MWMFSGIYGNPNWDLCHETWQLIRRLEENSNLPWLLEGDFNKKAIDFCQLIKSGFTGPEFTWCNNHVNDDIMWERLDRLLLIRKYKISIV